MSLPEEAQNAITEEEQVLAQLVEQLKAQLISAKRKLGQESLRARDLTAQIVSAQQAEDKQLLASDEAVAHALSQLKVGDIEVLEKLIEQPYFGRVVIEEYLDNGSTKNIDYKIGKAANTDCRIIDWKKAPISKLYYEYKADDEFSEVILGRERNGKILLRNSVEIQASRLVGLTCSAGSFRLEMGQWKQLKGPVSARSFGNYQQLPDILALITAEQFELITRPNEAALLIQGIAGSGKTSVALHRLAWLLSPGNSDLKASELLVLTPTLILKNYVTSTLGALGVNAVKVHTVVEWLEHESNRLLPNQLLDENKIIRRPDDALNSSLRRFFQSFALLKAIESRAKHLLDNEIKHIQNSWNWSEIPSGLKAVFDKAAATSKTINAFLDEISSAIKRGLSSISPNHNSVSLLQDLQSKITERSQAYSVMGLIQSVLADPNLIISCDISKLITPDLCKSARIKFDTDLNKQVLDTHLDALLVIAARALGNLASQPLGHIFVDEVQDLSCTELACVLASVKQSKDLTLAGDIAQQTKVDTEFTNWRNATDALGLTAKHASFVALSVSHRSTKQIMALADYVKGRDLNKTGRNGKPPIHFLCGTEDKAISATIRWLEMANEKYPNGLAGVICSNAKSARELYSILNSPFGGAVHLADGGTLAPAGIWIGYPEQMKGLEFISVLVFDASLENYPDEEFAHNRLYVAMTRAEENLCLVNWKRPSPMLPDASKGLLRVMTLRTEHESH